MKGDMDEASYLMEEIRDLPKDKMGQLISFARFLKTEAKSYDPFYSPENQALLRRSIADAEAGRLTVRELIED
ncbi:hypothetical protein FACS1894208_11960 [Clostridia bacterium]|nr:hypothetical protein FACS1894208_11960 [Clostridia bacterium]